ncbi:hypothetical protein [Mesorhizobium sp. B3-1-6]|uniref:hypothetical protein n=1 Tax=Mesorhizobium sp. B3-1-6 TaxID=2589895 RepID=UPI0032B11400
MTVIGQFRDLDRPDMFVWLRGFEDMETRKDALSAFYGGPVWAAHRDAANATMIDSDNVLLLKPAWRGAEFDLSDLQRPTAAEAESMNGGRRLPGFVEISIHHLQRGAEAGFAGRFEAEAVPLLAANGTRLLGAFVSEHAENTFPRLPVRAAETSSSSSQGSTMAMPTPAVGPPSPLRRHGGRSMKPCKPLPQSRQRRCV